MSVLIFKTILAFAGYSIHKDLEYRDLVFKLLIDCTFLYISAWIIIDLFTYMNGGY